MSNLAEKLCDADVIVVDDTAYNIRGHDNQQLKEGADSACLFTEEDQYREETSFFFGELLKHEAKGNLQVYTLQLWDNINPSTKDLERACEENFPGSEIITFMEAIERWSVLNKYELKALDDSLKLRTLGQAEDARAIITRATEQEYLNAKKANVAVQLMHAMQGGRNVVFYEWTSPAGSVCKGGRYGTEGPEYTSFYL